MATKPYFVKDFLEEKLISANLTSCMQEVSDLVSLYYQNELANQQENGSAYKQENKQENKQVHLDELSQLKEAMLYSVLNGGKRIRPLLVYIAGMLSNAALNKLILPAICVESLHSYTLVHDDLPDMDNDSLRRGLPTTHKKYNPALAILVGDSLQSYAFSILSQQDLPAKQILLQIKELAHAGGYQGVCLGQALDMQAEKKRLSIQELQTIHHFKTAKLLELSLCLGYYTGELSISSKIEQPLRKYAQHLGLLYQIKDDILDIEGTEEEIGKPVGSDLNNNKNTYVTILGLEKSKAALEEQKALALLELELIAQSQTPEHNARYYTQGVRLLKELLDFVINRNK